jgi:3-deoxy-D-manno-octulosonic acid kinase
MREAQVEFDNARILYDADTAAYAQGDWFNPEILAARGWLQGTARGRGNVQYFRCNGTDYVLRHYRRGGSVAVWLGDRYLWTGLDRTRAWREWRMLARLEVLGLPAPRPFAARVVKSGLFYRADLITAQFPVSPSLTERLEAGPLPDSTWREIGRVIRRFHEAGVWHPDLNAHNVLVDAKGAVVLVDFDRARFRRRGTRWREDNLSRLLRSLRKLKRFTLDFRFHESDFASLREGYRLA